MCLLPSAFCLLPSPHPPLDVHLPPSRNTDRLAYYIVGVCGPVWLGCATQRRVFNKHRHAHAHGGGLSCHCCYCYEVAAAVMMRVGTEAWLAGPLAQSQRDRNKSRPGSGWEGSHGSRATRPQGWLWRTEGGEGCGWGRGACRHRSRAGRRPLVNGRNGPTTPLHQGPRQKRIVQGEGGDAARVRTGQGARDAAL